MKICLDLGSSYRIPHCLSLNHNCIIYLPPLRQLSNEIPTILNLCLSHMNLNRPRQILAPDEETLNLLQGYEWPHNYTQFRSAVEELAVTITGQTITAENVSQVLKKERHVGAFNVQKENAVAPLDFNHTLAAERLGISRTTLWHLLQK